MSRSVCYVQTPEETAALVRVEPRYISKWYNYCVVWERSYFDKIRCIVNSEFSLGIAGSADLSCVPIAGYLRAREILYRHFSRQCIGFKEIRHPLAIKLQAPTRNRISKPRPNITHQLITADRVPFSFLNSIPTHKTNTTHNYTRKFQTLQNVRTHARILVIGRTSGNGGPLPRGGSRNSAGADGNVSHTPVGCALYNPKCATTEGWWDTVA